MSIETAFREILKMKYLAIPKAVLTQDVLLEEFGKEYEQTQAAWLLKCHHDLRPPANESEIEDVVRELGLDLTSDLRNLLTLSNGASLFVVPKRGTEINWNNANHVRYRLFDTDELVEINNSLYKTYRECCGSDSYYKDRLERNYVAFCDADNANFLAILLKGDNRGRVFFLESEYYYCPHEEGVTDLNYSISNTLEEWLNLVIDTGGWGGRGRDAGNL